MDVCANFALARIHLFCCQLSQLQLTIMCITIIRCCFASFKMNSLIQISALVNCNEKNTSVISTSAIETTSNGMCVSYVYIWTVAQVHSNVYIETHSIGTSVEMYKMNGK